MTFTSFAQNFEDVMLWRALQHVGKGFYIDAGAQHPTTDSVTKAFYDLGWTGINIEPNSHFWAMLEDQRPGDVNLQIALGEVAGEVVLQCVEDTGLSTVDENIARLHQEAGWEVFPQTVRMMKLSEVWAQFVAAGQVVHFLKVDVEGAEEAVLRGNDWTANRPWVVVVEATFPSSQHETYSGWEPILVEAKYDLVYTDGLNRFYVAREQMRQLASSFAYPPNVFDQFIRAGDRDNLVARQQLEELLEVARGKISALENELNQVYHQMRELEKNVKPR